jgi:branched-chain amino acid transport system ATP-binding protein
MPEALRLDRVRAGYGETVVLEDVAFGLAERSSLAVLGRNGVGKTTLLATIMGHTTFHSGEMAFRGQPLARVPAFERNRMGIGYVPQTRDIFPSLSVEENLTVAGRPGRWTLERVYELFPRLAERRSHMGNQISGGEQQMCSIGRALMGNPSLLLMDEPLEGLAPIIVEELTAAIRRMTADEGTAFVLVEQHAEVALSLSADAIVLERGSIVHRARSQDLLKDEATLERLIGLRLAEEAGAG